MKCPLEISSEMKTAISIIPSCAKLITPRCSETNRVTSKSRILSPSLSPSPTPPPSLSSSPAPPMPFSPSFWATRRAASTSTAVSAESLSWQLARNRDFWKFLKNPQNKRHARKESYILEVHFDQLCAQNDLIEKSSNQNIITLNILHFAETDKNYIKKLNFMWNCSN